MTTQKKYILLFILLFACIVLSIFSFMCSRLWCKDYYDINDIYIEDIYYLNESVFVQYNYIGETLFSPNGIDIIDYSDENIYISFVRSNIKYPSKVQISYFTLSDLLNKYDFEIEEFNLNDRNPDFVFLIEIENSNKKNIYLVDDNDDGEKLIWSKNNY